MTTRRAALYIGIALIALTAYTAWPQAKDAKKPATPPAPEKPKTREFLIKADELVHNNVTGIGEAKKVVVTDPKEGTVIHADLWGWNDKTKTAQATGNLLLNDPQADVTGDKADIDYNKSKRVAVLTGSVHITIKPKKGEGEAPPARPPAPAPVTVGNGKATAQTNPEEKEESVAEARKYPTEVTCDRVEYHYARSEKYALLTGHFKATQKLSDKTRTLTAEKAEWFGREERLLLYGPVHVEDTKGMKGDSPDNVTVYTKEGDERMQTKRFQGFFPIEEEEEEESAPTAPPKEKKP